MPTLSNTPRRRFALQLDGQEARKLWERGHVPVGELWCLCSEYPNMRRLRDRGVLGEGETMIA